MRIAAALCALAGLAAIALDPGLAAGEKRRGEKRRGERDRPASGALRDGGHQYQIVIPPAWRPIAAPPGTLSAYQTGGGRGHLAITRVELGLRHAGEPQALMADVERGLERATQGFRRVRRQAGQTGGVPTLDLWYERRRPSGPALMLSRFLFFRRHSMVVSIGLEPGARRSERRAAQAMLKSFTPFQAR